MLDVALVLFWLLVANRSCSKSHRSVAVSAPAQWIICVTDLANPSDCEQLAQRAALKFNGQVDILVLNAGIGMRGMVDSIADVSIARSLIRTTWAVCKLHYMLKLIKNTSGRIVVVSSISGRLGVPKYIYLRLVVYYRSFLSR